MKNLKESNLETGWVESGQEGLEREKLQQGPTSPPLAHVIPPRQ